ncbi:MAG TPA: hypothetical protein VIJ15_12075 [Dermatophilaceae bacterium]
MTFVEIAISVSVVLAIFALWLLGYVRPDIERDRLSDVRGLQDLDELRWNGWNRSMGWPPDTCWQGCAGLHRDDWWKAYVYRTCWQGCASLHRDDWWRVYLAQADQRREQPQRATSTWRKVIGRRPLTLSSLPAETSGFTRRNGLTP